MGTLAPRNHLHFSYTLLSPPPPPASFRSFSTKPIIFHRGALRRRTWNRRVPTRRLISASSDPVSPTYGGWDDPELLDDGNLSGTLDEFRSFLVSVGIDDRKHAFLFCLGFLSALAVSRVRLSMLAVLPVSVLVFVAGLFAGAARGGVIGDLATQIGRYQRSAKISNEKMILFGDFLDELEVKMFNLKNGLERIVNQNSVEAGEFKSYINVVESVRLTVVPVKKSMQESMDVDSENGPQRRSDLDIERNSNPKSSKKRKEADASGFYLVQFLGGLFQQSLARQKAPKEKDSVKRELTEEVKSTVPSIQNNANVIHDNTLTNVLEEKVSYSLSNGEVEDTKLDTPPKKSIDVRPEKNEVSSRTKKRNEQNMIKTGTAELDNRNAVIGAASATNGKQSSHSREGRFDNDVLLYGEDLNNLNETFRFTSTRESLYKVVLQHKSHKGEVRRQQNEPCDSDETIFNPRRQGDEIVSLSSEAEASLQSEQTIEIHDDAYFPFHDRRNRKLKSEKGTQNIGRKEGTTTSNDQINLGNQHSRHDGEADYSSSSAAVSADEEFNRYMKEGTDLLKKARECLKGQGSEKAAEMMLYKSARLLSTAVAMKPSSLLALGQLGNTSLLHGELKLKISRDFRALLSRNSSSMNGRWRQLELSEFSNGFPSKDKAASVLVDVCEECEELLIEAGRKYRMVLSIDGNDVRALYNWGPALSHRAQLIADIGPEAAFDADKVYLAAIDKFDAMMSRSNDYAPEALFRWGVALQQRSHLHPRNSKEKMKLLQQAKSLFEDALHVETDSPHVREALYSCISELDHSRQLE